ncbi:MAG: AMP-binding protein [Alphaproteobacteria bacterium]|nr:AMP-binding protein [Alphaproteobacteria bacterium]
MSLSLKHKAFLAASSISALHYDLQVEGSLPSDLKGCLFVILNHTSLSDPILVSRAMGLQGVHARFVTHTAFYGRHKWMMDQLGALPVPSTFDGKGDWTREKIRRATERLHQALEDGDNIAIYPSGQLKSGETEQLGGKTMVFDILSRFPETPVCIVELRGLMYSLTSRYFTGGVDSPTSSHMREILLRAPKRFMTERVPVQIKFRDPQVLPSFDCARDLNEHLEGIVNATPDFGPEWRKDLRTQADIERYKFARTAEASASTQLDPEMTAQVTAHLAGLPEIEGQGIAAEAIRPDMNLISDLGLDSLSEVELRVFAEDTFHVSIDPEVQILTVRDLIVACQGALAEVESGEPATAPIGWDEDLRNEPTPQTGETIAEAAIKTCYAQGLSAVYSFDPNATHFIRKSKKKPLMTYRDLLTRAIVVARVLQRELPDEKQIACMLPATPGATVFSLGVLLSGKTLVPLNWTNGSAALDSSIELAGVNAVFTSEAFLEKAAVALSPLAISKIVLAEDFSKKAGLRDLIAAMRLVGRKPDAILDALGNTARNDDIAVVLFTSGSEAAPKGVPLTHRNILSNVEGGFEVIGATSSDRVLAFLPPFHSFGLVQLMLMSLICGVKVVFSPDPKKFKHMAGLIERFGITVVAGTPDFLSGIIDAARGQEHRIKSARIWLSGAQKAPADLRAKVKDLGGKLLEGYGITETAPLITVNNPGHPVVGVGKPIKNTRVLIVDPATKSSPKETGEEGLILVTGPGVFGGYLGAQSSPFVELDGTRYYDTGDLGRLDSEGNLTISGRLKRFLKPFGEMVNLTLIEDALASAYPAGEDGPRVAVSGVDVEGKRSFIVLYATDASITKADANKAIKAAGLTNLSFVDCVEQMSEIPLLGSGKINHRALKDPQAILDAREAYSMQPTHARKTGDEKAENEPQMPATV